jgi:hypothetical protein
MVTGTKVGSQKWLTEQKNKRGGIEIYNYLNCGVVRGIEKSKTTKLISQLAWY